MTRRGRRGGLGLALLGLALLYPAWLVFVGAMEARTTEVDAPLVDGRDIVVPVKVGWPGLFSLRIEAWTTDDADLDGTESCLLDLPDPHTQPVPCAGVADRLHLNFRLEGGAGRVVAGNYGLAMAGRYQDRDREYAPFLGGEEMGNELLILEKLPRADYRLLVTAVHVPAGLVSAGPRVLLERHSDTFGLLSVLPMLVLSGLLGMAGVVVMVVGVSPGAKKRTGGDPATL